MVFRSPRERELVHHSHLRRRHRRLLRFLGLRLGYRGGNSSSRAFGLGWSGGGGRRDFGLGLWLVPGTRRSATALGGGRGGLWLRLWLGSWRGGRGRSRRRSWRSRSNIVRGQRCQLARHQHQLLHIPRRLTGWSDERGGKRWKRRSRQRRPLLPRRPRSPSA